MARRLLPMQVRLTKIDEFQFLTCLQHQLWGSKSARFKNWNPGDRLVVIVGKAIAGLAEVSGAPYISKQRVWDNGVFPHRIPVKFPHVILPENRPPVLGEIRDALTSTWGPKYGWGILNQSVLPDSAAATILKSIQSCPNDLARIQANLEQYLAEASLQRELLSRPKGKVHLPKQDNGKLTIVEETIGSKAEESAHTRAQGVLVRLGKVAGCSVWIAQNDRNRVYRGKKLGEGCLKSLPNLGLNEEATSRIAVIDIIWVRQNLPVCAFEVETTTSVYSGLLRMSDLLALVPLLRVKLYIVAPKERQNKVLAELARPTFQKIGINEFCRFIPAEDLESLLEKLVNLEGHVQPSIVDTIAVQLEEEVQSELE